MCEQASLSVNPERITPALPVVHLSESEGNMLIIKDA